MRKIIFVFIAMMSLSCAQDKRPIVGESDWQRKKNADFKDATKSPLIAKDRKAFVGLDFFEVDSSFVVKAILERTPDAEFFGMKTTTERLTRERIYGILTFELKGVQVKLNLYQGEEHLQTEGFEDYLFLPFLDDSNGDSTYGGGRYIDLRIPKGNTIMIDFNKAYNPYCAYNEKFSCPIVPRVNRIGMLVNVGEKSYLPKDS